MTEPASEQQLHDVVCGAILGLMQKMEAAEEAPDVHAGIVAHASIAAFARFTVDNLGVQVTANLLRAMLAQVEGELAEDFGKVTVADDELQHHPLLVAIRDAAANLMSEALRKGCPPHMAANIVMGVAARLLQESIGNERASAAIVSLAGLVEATGKERH